jgi:2-C-methyl-D-erythritol 4-phosphate cytidylyltransferase
MKKYRIDKISKIVEGGRRRQDSVLKGVEALDSRTDLVLIHDAVRPFITKEMVFSVIREGQRTGAAVVGVPVKATIKEVKTQKPKRKTKPIVKETLNRNNLWEIQTPQVFKKELLLKAYKRFGNVSVTDDAMLVEKLGAKVSVVLGSYKNIKITTPEDLVIARAILKLKAQNANLKTAT